MKKRPRSIAQALAWAFFLGVVGCSSARMSDHEPDRLFRAGQYDAATEKLKSGLKSQGENGRDVLLYLLDLGLALHTAGRYDESNQYFLKADKMAEIKDYTSLATEGATLLVSENAQDYKGEDFEKVLINTYLAMNYALMGNDEDALVEARRVNQKLYMMTSEGKRKYKQNAFARYISAILYESEGNFNDAYVDYKNTLALEPEFPGLSRDLWRMARFLDETDEMDKWDEQFGLTAADHASAKDLDPRNKKEKSEVIVIFENGISPAKHPNPSFTSLPKFVPRFNPVLYANVELNGKQAGNTARLENIEATAIENLDEKYGGLIAKKVAGVVTKAVVADQVARRTNNPALGYLAALVLLKTDEADLRSWNLLPKDLQLLRIPVEPGSYTVKVLPIGAPPLPEKTIQVAHGKKVFVDFRYTP